jgi:two-component system OmpR family response regulator
LSEAPNKGATLRFAGWKLDRARRRLETSEGVKVALSDGEFDLLVAFVEHPQRVLTREQLLDLSRGRSPVPFDRSVDMQVGRLRRKIEARPEEPELIETVRGRGYIFTPSVEKP